eukprot:191029-Pleurochrysis_carterae.AAC.1
MKKDARTNVVWVPSQSSRTTPPRNQRYPRSARQQTSSPCRWKRCTLARTRGSARSHSRPPCRAG